MSSCPEARPYSGLSTSGDNPRHPLMHSVDPGSPPVYGLGNVSLAFMPSSHRRLDQVCHLGLPASITSM